VWFCAAVLKQGLKQQQCLLMWQAQQQLIVVMLLMHALVFVLEYVLFHVCTVCYSEVMVSATFAVPVCAVMLS
jgi:hypothetical protein